MQKMTLINVSSDFHFLPQAAPVIQKLNEELTKMNNEVLQGISKEELQQVETTMTKILTRFKERNETQHEKNNV